MSENGKLSQIWSFVAWLLRILLVFAITLAILMPLIVLALPDVRPEPLMLSVEMSNTWLVLVRTLAAVFLLYVAWRMVRALVFYPLGSWRVFGATASTRLAALGITALLAPKGVTALIFVPINFLSQLADRISHFAARAVILDSGDPNAMHSLKEPVLQLSIIVQDTIGELGRALGRAIEAVPIIDTVLSLACWAVLGNLMSTEIVSVSAGQSGKNRLMSLLQALSSVQRYAIVLSAVFLFGAYLSVAAIVAIPWLHEEHVSPTLTRDSLEKVLTALVPTAAQLGEHVRVPLAEEKPMASLSEYLANVRTSTDISAIYVKRSLQEAIDEAQNARTAAIGQAQRMIADIEQQVSQMKQVALSAFDLETASPMSSQERDFFVRGIQRSVSADVATMQSTIGNCAGTLVDSDKRLRGVAESTRNLLTAHSIQGAQLQTQTESRDQLQLVLLAQVSSQISNVTASMRDACDVQITHTGTYAPPEPGTGWGPFGLVAHWLLRTKSFALTLITGMLGFGLLGSVISTFVRAGIGIGAVSLTGEIISVLVRGLSAAVVVFLAVKGGLAIFSNGDAEPNAYVVFFTCLIGAVFSEDVWKWAREKFLENLSAQPDSAGAHTSMADTINEESVAADDGHNSQRSTAP